MGEVGQQSTHISVQLLPSNVARLGLDCASCVVSIGWLWVGSYIRWLCKAVVNS